MDLGHCHLLDIGRLIVENSLRPSVYAFLEEGCIDPIFSQPSRSPHQPNNLQTVTWLKAIDKTTKATTAYMGRLERQGHGVEAKSKRSNGSIKEHQPKQAQRVG